MNPLIHGRSLRVVIGIYALKVAKALVLVLDPSLLCNLLLLLPQPFPILDRRLWTVRT